MDFNTCIATTDEFHTVAYYSHLIPVSISLLLAFFVLFKSHFSLLSKLFFLFVFGFCLWLLSDVVLWTNSDYHLITALWAPLDFVNVMFYLLAAYFFAVLIRGRDIAHWFKIAFLILAVPAWWLTFSGQSIVNFYQSYCEATNNDWLTQYKLWIEVAVLAFIMFYGTIAFFTGDKAKRKSVALVGFALVLFLALFASTEYISSMTGIYEINLYSLFVLPVFLILIIFSITNLNIFSYRSFGMQLLIYILLILVGSQFFFLQDATYRALTLVTFVLSLFLGGLLTRNIRREEQLALALEVANEGQADLLHIINHQIKGYMTKARLVFDDLLHDEGYGLNEKAKPMIQEGFASVTEGVTFVQSFLTASNIERGTFTYSFEPMDLKTVVETVVAGQKNNAEKKGLAFDLTTFPADYSMKGDKVQLAQAIRNLLDNSINYTPQGSIKAELRRTGDRFLFIVKDTGVGLSAEVKPKLFTKGGRAVDSQKINVNSTGFGLAFVKGVVEAHKGHVWAESSGVGKGSSFYLELPVA